MENEKRNVRINLDMIEGAPLIGTGASGIVIGTGNANTSAIVALYGTESNAARMCYDLTLGGYSDWYLPSQDELNKLYVNRVTIGGFENLKNYWSSSESKLDAGTACAWFQYFGNGAQLDVFKAESFRVRAVRSF